MFCADPLAKPSIADLMIRPYGRRLFVSKRRDSTDLEAMYEKAVSEPYSFLYIYPDLPKHLNSI